MTFCFVVVVLAIIAAAIAASAHQANKAEAAWSSAATRLSLVYRSKGKFGDRMLRGKLEGYPVVVRTFKRSNGKSSTTYTHFELEYSQESFEFKLTRSTAFSSVAAFFRSQDIEIGASEFDKIVIVQSNRPKHVASYLTSERQKAVLNVFLAYPGARIKNGEIEWEKRGLVTSAAEIEGVLRRFVRFAQVMDGVREPADLEEEALEEMVAPDPEPQFSEAIAGVGALSVQSDQDDAAVHEPEPVVFHVDDLGEVYDLPPVVQPGMTVTEAAEAVEAERRGERPARELGDPADDPVVEEELAVSETSAPSEAPEPTPAPEPPAPSEYWRPEPPPAAPTEAAEPPAPASPEPAPSSTSHDPTPTGGSLPESQLETTVFQEITLGGVDDPTNRFVEAGSDASLAVADVCGELFASGLLGSKADQAFAERYLDAEVAWEGKLERLDRYFSDMVFEGGPGTKATVVVHEIGEGYAARKVEAVLQLGPEAADELRTRVGETLRFRGRLAKCEAFLRRLLVREATVEAS